MVPKNVVNKDNKDDRGAVSPNLMKGTTDKTAFAVTDCGGTSVVIICKGPWL